MSNSVGGLLKNILRRHSSTLRNRGRILKQFANKIGLVYFGTVDQHTDDHQMIRGLTVSTTHQDSHYAVGAFDGYDVSIVDRFDIISDQSHQVVAHNWLILQIDLQSEEIFPHLFLKPVTTTESFSKFFTAFNHLSVINTLLLGAHSPEFHSRYQAYAASTHALNIEEVFTPTVTNTIAARLWPHAVEVFEGKLYLYTTESILTPPLLESALESGLWLASVLDRSED